MIKTDVLIIGAGPVGLFAVFEAGLMKLKCHIIDVVSCPGGQLTELYPKKPIYDIPGYPKILAGKLIDNLLKQAKPFKPGFTLGERADSFKKIGEFFEVTTNMGTKLQGKVIFIAGGLGSMEPRKPKIDLINNFEKKGIEFYVKDPDNYLDKKISISGGGDSALDWAIYFSKKCKHPINLIHRSKSFRANKDSVDKIFELKKEGKLNLYLDSEVFSIEGKNGSLNLISTRDRNGREYKLETDCWFPLFGLVPKLGPLGEWGLDIVKNAIKVDNTNNYSTNIKGIFAIGDINTYEGKLKLILCGFHEATLAVHGAYKIIYPDKKKSLKYTTIQGVTGFD
tara:strand:- start:190 stop:1203 length:1014 start_codon:yes stop_codon:yes gene_type:complete